MFGGKLIAGIFIVGLLFAWLKEWAFLILGILLLLYLIRLIADWYWWMKDNGKI